MNRVLIAAAGAVIVGGAVWFSPIRDSLFANESGAAANADSAASDVGNASTALDEDIVPPAIDPANANRAEALLSNPNWNEDSELDAYIRLAAERDGGYLLFRATRNSAECRRQSAAFVQVGELLDRYGGSAGGVVQTLRDARDRAVEYRACEGVISAIDDVGVSRGYWTREQATAAADRAATPDEPAAAGAANCGVGGSLPAVCDGGVTYRSSEDTRAEFERRRREAQRARTD